MTKIYIYAVIIISTLTFISCSDDSTGPGDLNFSQGQGGFTVTGAVNAEHEGEAWYVIDRDDDGTVFQIFVSDVEFSTDPNANDEVTFVLEFRQDSGSESFSISTGTFEVGENTTFTGLYADVNSATAYETIGSNGGAITITSHSNGQLDAEFEFAGANREGEGTVTVKGGLRASCIGGQFNPNCS